MSDTVLLICLGLFGSVIVFQQLFFAYQLQQLINKLMSRNYNDYVFNEKLGKETSQPLQDVGIGQYASHPLRPQETLEDLGVLEGLQIR